MRDAGLLEAIRAAGGISALARSLGIAQPSLSVWSRVPAERVLAVEAATGVGRATLRPDLYPEGEHEGCALDPIEAARARLYLLLARLVLTAPDGQLIEDLRRLAGDDSPLGAALGGLAAAADRLTPEAIAREHFALFVGVGRGELLPYASYYLTGFLYERPLVRAREDFARLGVEREVHLSEPEDHVGILFEVMAGVITGKFEAEAGEEHRFFGRHLAPWTERFFEDAGKAEGADFYRAVARLGREFMRIEREAFALEAVIEADVAASRAGQGAQA